VAFWEWQSVSACVTDCAPRGNGRVKDIFEGIRQIRDGDFGVCQSEPPLQSARGRPLGRQRSPEQLSERHFGVDLEDPFIGIRYARNLEDPMPHSVALHAWPRPSPRYANRLRFLIRRRFQYSGRECGENGRPPFANELTCGSISLAQGRFREPDRNVNAYGGRIRPCGGQRSGVTRKASAVEASFVERNGEPFAATCIDTKSLHASMLRRVRLKLNCWTTTVLATAWLIPRPHQRRGVP
jgi:hypothetical protein